MLHLFIGCDTKIKDDDGNDALHYAARHDQVKRYLEKH